MGENLATTLNALGSIFTGLMGFVTTVVDTITSTPILFIPFGVTLTYSIIKISKRLLHI